MKPFNIALFRDGRPGHEKQSLAILESLRKMVPIQVEEIPVRRLSLPATVAGYLRLLWRGSSATCPACRAPDLLLGTGSSTHLPMLSSKQRYRVPAVVCMAPDPYLRRYFDLCFVPRHDGLQPTESIFLTEGPPVARVDSRHRRPDQGLVLIGGDDPASHAWSTSAILADVQAIAQIGSQVHWHVSSSPRTPQQTCEQLQALAAAIPNITFYDFRQTPAGWVEEHYGLATIAWVTADSMSMLYEALTAGCQVGVLPVQWRKSENKFNTSVELLRRQGLVMSLAEYRAGNLPGAAVQHFDEAGRCAAEICRRWLPNL